MDYRTIDEIVCDLEKKGTLRSGNQVVSMYLEQNKELIKKAKAMGEDDILFLANVLFGD